ncbi:hypothetical protein QR680_016712 [Steinernema hermaphroditum]|uniref:Uncharacterized protein n=1 Tax=Steinernema hermaphroditum TaxID=289476 RepID=A0AA39HE79_9BILA|nr:hypothetical protein QR680_016712 [Steinernema hermaphroditum]
MEQEALTDFDHFKSLHKLLRPFTALVACREEVTGRTSYLHLKGAQNKEIILVFYDDKLSKLEEGYTITIYDFAIQGPVHSGGPLRLVFLNDSNYKITPSTILSDVTAYLLHSSICSARLRLMNYEFFKSSPEQLTREHPQVPDDNHGDWKPATFYHERLEGASERTITIENFYFTPLHTRVDFRIKGDTVVNGRRYLKPRRDQYDQFS